MFQKISRKKKMLGFVIVLICIIVVLACLLFLKRQRNSVRDAIFALKAFYLRDNEEYFIVGSYFDYAKGRYYYLDGKNKIKIELTGASPYYELGGCIATSEAANRFLVKGYIDSELSEFMDERVLVVETWEIIAPIRRAYASEDPMIRFFYPTTYFDQHDINSGAYFDVEKSCRALMYMEREWIIQNSKFPGYIITSDYVEETLQWYIIEDESYIPIDLSGRSPEPHFNEVVLAEKKNRFLILGNFNQINNTIYVDEWHILYSIQRGVPREERPSYFYRSRHYFDRFDIQHGTYIP